MKSVIVLTRHLSFIAAVLWSGCNIHAQQPNAVKPIKGNPASDLYEINQAYGGKSFWKDNNIWVYTRKFAELFGMPERGISEELLGIEAVAFRVEDAGYRLCGMGGGASNCFPTQDRCMLDIYIDERKHPLPWAYPEQKADWYEYYNSSQWLRVPKDEDPLNKPTERIIPNKRFQGDRGLRAVFADPETKEEVAMYSGVALMGYRRMAKKGLTMLTLDTFCGLRKKDDYSGLMLATTESSSYYSKPPRKIFLKIFIPESFLGRAIERLSEYRKRAQDYLKGRYQSMGAVPSEQ